MCSDFREAKPSNEVNGPMIVIDGEAFETTTLR